MITQEIKLHQEPVEVKSVAWEPVGKIKYSQEELEDAVKWAEMCGLTVGSRYEDTQMTDRRITIKGYRTDPSKVSSVSGYPTILVVEVDMGGMPWESYYAVEELLDKRFQYINPGK